MNRIHEAGLLIHPDFFKQDSAQGLFVVGTQKVGTFSVSPSLGEAGYLPHGHQHLSLGSWDEEVA